MPRPAMLLSLSLLCLLPLSITAAKETTRDKLVALASANNGVIKLNSETYNLITSPTRNWSAVIQLTALKSFKCAPCKDLDPSFRALGSAWSKVPVDDRDQHFFATLDYEDGQDIFRKLALNTAPALHLHPPSKGPRRPANGKSDALAFDFGSGFDPALLAEQLSRYTPVPIPYKAPPNYALIFTVAASLLASAAVARFILPILLSRWTWALITIITSLVMVGGFMFVRIRGMPYVAAGQNGAQLIAPGFQSQYGIEVQIVAALYGLLSLSFVSLTLIVPRHPSAARQRYGVYVWTGVSITLFSVLVSLFKIKNGGYPFRLLL